MESLDLGTGKKGRVLVAMSGGVDSSVAAALLKDQGYDVVGVTMQVWDYSADACDIQEGNGTCCSSTDVDDARAVADKLDIPFYVVNCEAKFQAYVIDEFVGSYLEGRTPIPCVNCNTYLKFDHLVQKMRELECDYLATGHYAQVCESVTGRPAIRTSCDDWKDQTYFLFTINPDLIPKLIFPVGHLKKAEVRRIAEERDLVVARKKDSTGICFIGKGGHAEFISQRVAPDLLGKGLIKRHPDGEVLGEHQGVHHFTYGQRKGLGVATGTPLFVVKIEPQSQTIWLGEEKDLYSSSLEVKNLSWLDEVRDGEELRVKVRYAHAGSTARIRKIFDVETDRVRGRYQIEFLEPQRAITPGQAAVMYRGDQLVGGGWIV
ncbi:MAG: tRNA 2-thiouridine(34) synthase MnmA [Bdellovibrionales bacterium]